MSVHGLKHVNTAVLSEIVPATKQGSKSSTFSTLLGSLGSSTATKAQASTTANEAATSSESGFAALFGNYSTLKTPIESTTKTAPADTGTGTGTGSGTGTGTTAPFVATYEQNVTETGPDGSVSSMNSMELATSSTAAEVAQLLGGTVVDDTPNGAYTATAPTREISVPGSNVEVNAGLVANLFSTYGTQAGSFAWQQIDSDLGINVAPPSGS
jgi:hypothetical protein